MYHVRRKKGRKAATPCNFYIQGKHVRLVAQGVPQQGGCRERQTKGGLKQRKRRKMKGRANVCTCAEPPPLVYAWDQSVAMEAAETSAPPHPTEDQTALFTSSLHPSEYVEKPTMRCEALRCSLAMLANWVGRGFTGSLDSVMAKARSHSGTGNCVVSTCAMSGYNRIG